jgi:hypothetical protein
MNELVARGDLGNLDVQNWREQVAAGTHAHFISLLQERFRQLPIDIESKQRAQLVALSPENSIG